MITIYSEKSIFEDIVFYKKNEYPILREILRNHAKVCLNITEEDLLLEEPKTEMEKQQPQSVIFNHILETGRIPSPKKEDFDAINEDNSIIADKPRSIFLLNCTEVEAKELQEDYGVIVQCSTNINDNILSGSYRKKLKENSRLTGQHNCGWKNLLNFNQPPLNSMVIIDSYLFKDIEDFRGQKFNVGKVNLIELLDSLMPLNLKTEFQITIFTEDFDRTQDWKEKMKIEINHEVKNLRHYLISIELFFCSKIKELHDRRIISNYIYCTSTKGFSVFKISDKLIVRNPYEFSFCRVFSGLKDSLGGETDYDFASTGLEDAKKVCRISGIITENRLINDV